MNNKRPILTERLIEAELLKNLRYNLTVNVIDGAFFGFAMGFASFVTIIPLFVSQLTSSALLIGLIPAIHNAGWQFPQLFTTGWIARQSRYKSLVVKLTISERTPFLGMALVAALLPVISTQAALFFIYALLIVQGLGAGLTANPWTTMIGKIIPSDRRGTFFGVQAAGANGLAAISAVAAGLILDRLPSPLDFTLCFLLCSLGMVISWTFLNMTREPAHIPNGQPGHPPSAAGDSGIEAKTSQGEPLSAPASEEDPARYAAPAAASLDSVLRILRSDINFRWFLLARNFSQFAIMAFAFYTVFAVRVHGASEAEVGGMTGVMLGMQIIGNIIMGMIGDRHNRKSVMEFALVATAASAILAWWAPSAGWFYLVYALAALGNVGVWTIGIAMSLDFGTEAERPAYVGMANTLIAPANILAPFVGGWLADSAGYPTAFGLSAAAALAALAVFRLFVVVRAKTPGVQPATM